MYLLKTETDFFDHALIIEKGSLKPTTLTALQEENFKVEYSIREISCQEYKKRDSENRI